MSNVVRLPSRVRPLRKTYVRLAPYEVEREDADDGSIHFHVVDMRSDSYRTVFSKSDDGGRDPFAKHDATEAARGLNLLVSYGLETKLPKAKNWDEIAEREEGDYE